VLPAAPYLAEHRVGVAWTVVPSPDPSGRAGESALNGVAASSACNAWRAGYHGSGTTVPAQALALHWG
jgi:hypothetical protein